jgi:hypothetical protein
LIRNRKKGKSEAKKMTVSLAKIGDSQLADELSKLVDKNKQAGEIIDQIVGKEVVQSQPTKAEIAFKNMQEKKVIHCDFFLRS